MFLIIFPFFLLFFFSLFLFFIYKIVYYIQIKIIITKEKTYNDIFLYNYL